MATNLTCLRSYPPALLHAQSRHAPDIGLKVTFLAIFVTVCFLHRSVIRGLPAKDGNLLSFPQIRQITSVGIKPKLRNCWFRPFNIFCWIFVCDYGGSNYDAAPAWPQSTVSVNVVSVGKNSGEQWAVHQVISRLPHSQLIPGEQDRDWAVWPAQFWRK